MQTIARPDPAAAGGRRCPARRAERAAARSASGSRGCAQHCARPAGATVGRVRELGDDADGARLGRSTRTSSGATLARRSSTRPAFLSPHGLRAVSKRYEGNPYTRRRHRRARRSTTSRPSRRRRMFGGNSNWRGPGLAARQLPRDPRSSCIYHRFFGDDVHARVPDRLGQRAHVRRDRAGPRRPARRRSGCPDADGRRPRLRRHRAAPDATRPGRTTSLFNEYFHGDNGAGLGATHQTGWTALVADLILDPPSAGLERLLGRAERAAV